MDWEIFEDIINQHYSEDNVSKTDMYEACEKAYLIAKTAPVDEVLCSVRLCKLVNLQEQYIDLLTKELDETSSIADIHGWKSERFNQGETLRVEIAHIREQLA
jgi:hypothetical protein